MFRSGPMCPGFGNPLGDLPFRSDAFSGSATHLTAPLFLWTWIYTTVRRSEILRSCVASFHPLPPLSLFPFLSLSHLNGCIMELGGVEITTVIVATAKPGGNGCKGLVTPLTDEEGRREGCTVALHSAPSSQRADCLTD